MSYLYIKFVTKKYKKLTLNIENQILNKVKKAKKGTLFLLKILSKLVHLMP